MTISAWRVWPWVLGLALCAGCVIDPVPTPGQSTKLGIGGGQESPYADSFGGAADVSASPNDQDAFDPMGFDTLELDDAGVDGVGLSGDATLSAD